VGSFQINAVINYTEGSAQPLIECTIKNSKIMCILDTGAAVNLMPKEIFHKLNLAYTGEKIDHQLKGVSGQELHILGYTLTNLVINAHSFHIQFVVAEGIREDILLLGIPFVTENKLTLDFENNTLKTNIAIKNNDIQTLREEVFEPMSAKIISAKSRDKIGNPVACHNLNIKGQEFFEGKIYLTVSNPSQTAITLKENEVIAKNYSESSVLEINSTEYRSSSLSPGQRTGQVGNLSTHSPGTVGAQPGHSRGKI
jgi:hypothetical protein